MKPMTTSEHTGEKPPAKGWRTWASRPFPWNPSNVWKRQGKIGYILLWAVGVPIPILVLIFLLRGCR